MTFIQWLEHIDKIIFAFIQVKLSAPWLDGIMLTLRNPLTWVPLYIFMLYWVLKFDRNIYLKFICITIICFAITDFSSSHIFKPFFERLRPCYDAEMSSVVRGIIGCGGKYSFPSSHATNHFGLAAFWFYAIHLMTGKKWYWLWLWAFMISYAQIYVGIHFPLDIAGGAILGTSIGYGLSRLFRIWTRPLLFKTTQNSSLSLP